MTDHSEELSARTLYEDGEEEYSDAVEHPEAGLPLDTAEPHTVVVLDEDPDGPGVPADPTPVRPGREPAPELDKRWLTEAEPGVRGEPHWVVTASGGQIIGCTCSLGADHISGVPLAPDRQIPDGMRFVCFLPGCARSDVHGHDKAEPVVPGSTADVLAEAFAARWPAGGPRSSQAVGVLLAPVVDQMLAARAEEARMRMVEAAKRAVESEDDPRAAIVSDLRFLAEARKDYCHRCPEHQGDMNEMGPMALAVHEEHATALWLADIVEGTNTARGWLPSWRWSEWTARQSSPPAAPAPVADATTELRQAVGELLVDLRRSYPDAAPYRAIVDRLSQILDADPTPKDNA